MKLQKVMLELLEQINSVEQTATSVEMALQTGGAWYYCTIHRDPNLSYSYAKGYEMEREEMFKKMIARTSGIVAVIAYYTELPNVSQIKHVTAQRHIENKHQIVLSRTV